MANDLKMTGDGVVEGGQYGKVRVTGDCTVSSAVSCDSLRLTGNMTVEGDITSADMRIIGDMNVNGSAHVGDARVVGDMLVKGAWKGQKLNVVGLVDVGDACAVEHAEVRGVLNVKGLCNVDTLVIRSPETNVMGEIGGKSLTVRKTFLDGLISQKPALTCQSIEVDTAELFYVVADEVRGTNITIGKGCVIGRVVCHGTLKISKSATVKVVEK